MYTRSGSAISFAFVLAFVLAMATPACADANAPWTVSTISGRASIREAGREDNRPLTQGEFLKTGDRIETGDDGRVVVTRDKQTVTITANSNFEVVSTESSVFTRIYQNLGTLMFHVDKRPEKHFEVDTPYLHAVVKGTTFTVTVDQGGASVHVADGLVEVTEPVKNHRILVARGYTASIGSGQGSSLVIGVDSNNGHSQHGPRIKSDLGSGNVNIEQVSEGLLRRDDKKKHGSSPEAFEDSNDNIGASTSDTAKKARAKGNSNRSSKSKKNGKK